MPSGWCTVHIADGDYTSRLQDSERSGRLQSGRALVFRRKKNFEANLSSGKLPSLSLSLWVEFSLDELCTLHTACLVQGDHLEAYIAEPYGENGPLCTMQFSAYKADYWATLIAQCVCQTHTQGHTGPPSHTVCPPVTRSVLYKQLT